MILSFSSGVINASVLSYEMELNVLNSRLIISNQIMFYVVLLVQCMAVWLIRLAERRLRL